MNGGLEKMSVTSRNALCTKNNIQAEKIANNTMGSTNLLFLVLQYQRFKSLRIAYGSTI